MNFDPSDRQFALWLNHYERLKETTTARFICPDALPIQYTRGDLYEWLGGYRPKPFEVRRGLCNGEFHPLRVVHDAYNCSGNYG